MVESAEALSAGISMKLLFPSWVFLLMTPVSWAGAENSVTHFLTSADRQFETRSQCQEIKTALTDMLRFKPKRLKATRYKDYQDHAGTWKITELLGKYFVPSPPAPLQEKEFFRDYERPSAKAAIQKSLKSLGDCSSAAVQN